MAKYNNRTYKTGSYRGGINLNFKLIMCENKICITSIIQTYVLNSGSTYVLLTRVDRMETINP